MNKKDKFLVFAASILFISVFISGGMPLFSNTFIFSAESNPRLSASGLTINSPVEGKIYTPQMEGYYPGTYGFENDEDGNIPSGWVSYSTGSCYTKVFSEFQGHKKVLRCYDKYYGTGKWDLRNSFEDQSYGTIEFWMATSSTSKRHTVYIDGDISSSMTAIRMDDGYLQYYTSTGYHNLSSITANTWYHISIDFRCNGAPAYEGLDEKKFQISVNGGDESGPYTLDGNDDVCQVRLASTGLEEDFYGYYDAFGFSWDPSYEIGDNLPMEGYYPATYGFESDEDDSFPDEWTDDKINGYAKIISEKGEHKKVLDLYDNVAASGKPTKVYNNLGQRDSGTIELWIRQSGLGDTDKRGQITGAGDSGNVFHIRMVGGSPAKWVVLNGESYVDISGAPTPVVDMWYHIRIDFDLGEEEYYISIDGHSPYGPYNFGVNEQLERLYLHTYSYGAYYHVYFDAIGYSWDPTYFEGNNREEGFLLDYTSDIELSDVKYELNGHEKAIDGDTYLPTYPFTEYTVKVTGYGPDSTYYESELITYSTAPIEHFDNHWGLTEIRADDVWYGFGVKGAGVKVLVIDSGIALNHPDLKANYKGGYDFFNGDTIPEPPYNDASLAHGTKCSGIIAAVDNNFGGIGVAPEVELYMARISNDDGGTCWEYIHEAILWGIDQHTSIDNPYGPMDVISMSFVYWTEGTYASDIIDACEAARDAGTILVACSGNAIYNDPSPYNDPSWVRFPASLNDYVIAVGAINEDLERGSYENNNYKWASCYGTELDLVAPGKKIYTTAKITEIYEEEYAYFKMTSAACPFVAGVCALILSASSYIRETLTGAARVNAVRNCLYYDPIWNSAWGSDPNNEYGHGLVDAYTAVEYALAYS